VCWRKPWLRGPRRSAPRAAFTIERASERAPDSAVEREILEAIETRADRLASAPEPTRPAGYRDAAPRPPSVRLRVEEVLRPRTLASAARELRSRSRIGAPVAVAAAIAEFAKTDPARMKHLRLLLAEHRRRVMQA
jgi:hypothetical protein